MPGERKAQFDVLSGFKELANESDHLIAENLNHSKFSGLDAWFSAIKDTISKIKNSNNLADIEYPPHISFFLGEEYKSRNVDTAITEVQREHVHTTVQSEMDYKTVQSEKDYKTVESESSKIPSVSITVSETESSHFKNESNIKIVTPASKSRAYPPCTVAAQKLNTPHINKIDSSINVLGNDTCSSQNLMTTPILNRTFNKAINKTLILDSANNCEKTKIIDSTCNDSGIKVFKSISKTLSSNVLKDSDSGVVTRSGTKRRSSRSKSKMSKKQKIETPSTPASRSAKSRQPLVDKNVMKTAVALSSEQNCKKQTAVIVPPVQKKTVVSKEKQIIEEIKKKDEKTNENMKRILAERQMKAEQNKKNREEKRAKLLQKRMQIEKEKEERLQKAEAEAKKSQVKPSRENTKNSIMKTRTQELIDQHAKTSVPGVLTSSKQNVTNNDALVRTPVHKNSDDCESYELTPVPNSSTYNFSDSEDEKPSGKPIPLWAQGVHLRSALLHQYYYPPDLNELFGTEIDSPDLAKMFCVKKERYLKRTSSAIWNHASSFCHR